MERFAESIMAETLAEAARRVEAERAAEQPYWVPPDDEHFLLQSAKEAQARRDPKKRAERQQRRSAGRGARRPVGEEAQGPTDLLPAHLRQLQVAARRNSTRVSMFQYLSDMRDVVRTRLRAAHERDEKLRIGECMRAEKGRLAVAAEYIQNHTEALQRFLEQDCNENQELRKQVEEQAQLESALEEKHGELRAQLAASERRVYVLAERWLKAKVYQNFLMQVSPMWWRKQHDPGLDGPVSGMDEALQRYQPQPATLDAMLTVFQEDAGTTEDFDKTEPAPLFFKEPEELMTVFDAMERHILNSLLLTEELWAPLEAMRHDLNQTVEVQQQQLADVTDRIEDLEARVAWEVSRTDSLRARVRHLLQGRLSRLLVSDDALALGVCVEDAYEACVGSGGDKLALLEMMTAVENKYWALLRELDSLPPCLVARTRKAVHTDEKRRMRRAMLAEQQVVRLQRGEYRLEHALHPPPPPPTAAEVRARVVRSPLPTLKPPRPSPPPPLTVSEEDWLAFRADFCPYSDQPAAFLADKAGPPSPSSSPHSSD